MTKSAMLWRLTERLFEAEERLKDSLAAEQRIRRAMSEATRESAEQAADAYNAKRARDTALEELEQVKRQWDEQNARDAQHPLEVRHRAELHDMRTRMEEALAAAKSANEQLALAKVDGGIRAALEKGFETSDLAAERISERTFQRVIETAMLELCESCREVAADGGTVIPGTHFSCLGAIRAVNVVERARYDERRERAKQARAAEALQVE